MARTNALSPEALAALGAAKLARIILDEVETNAAFRRRVVAATASGQGAEAVAKLLDRRLAGLERARGRVDWEKERDFAADLSATVGTILKELAPLSPDRAVHTLLRFIDTHGAVLERIDDSSGRIQAVYWGASEAMPDLVERLSPGEQTVIPDRLMKSLAKDTHGLAAGIAVAVVPKLPEPVLARWDEDLRQRSGDVRLVEIRQAIADMRGDLDLYLALELERPDWRQNPLRAAERLLAAGRLDEALSWVRRPRKGGVAYATEADIADGRIRRPATLERVRLEARILEAMKDRPAAQALRWDTFENTLDAEILREYLRKLDDFREFEELERAFAVAAAGPLPYTGLAFFIAWPRLDRAARLVMERGDQWQGQHYGALVPAAEALEEEFPLAATILYRALLDDILARAKSPAYAHGARYLARLRELSDRISGEPGLTSHPDYVIGLRKKHGRKLGFWSIADGKRGT